jgi:hypothetical protein
MKLFIKSGNRELTINDIEIGDNPVMGEAYIKLVGKSKVKTTNSVNPERIASINEFAEKTATQNRLQQGLDKMNELGVPVSPASTGVYIQWVVRDILREEADTMAESGFEAKDVTGPIANIARKFWMENISAY